ncbi:MAG TPA: helix-turn-helix domain-containing protein [Acidisoma sp.]|uniref:helix-turn-helix domain-containing protein n=1 Tax=Acidisoma sp. TaxID=1872115 RepID=UPI002C25192B|nr:helix-turn-helix domain-containing protein [Acidisoma sp.]HTI02640.1 helix-turn-helix domain-containing protein [Acidisoma sp.]
MKPGHPAADGQAALEGVAARIRESRRSLGLTQEELARRIGVSRSAIAQWETDRTGQVRANLARVAAVLGVSIGYLLTGESYGIESGAETADERALLNLYRQIQDAGRAELLRLARRILVVQEQSGVRRRS